MINFQIIHLPGADEIVFFYNLQIINHLKLSKHMENYDASSGSGAAAMLAVFSFLMIPFLIISVIMIIAHWKIFEKAGKPGWAAIIPIYNIIVLLEIIGKPVWWIIMFLIPC